VGGDPGPLRRFDLVAHEGQQRRHDQGRTGASAAQQRRGDEVHGRLPPAGALDDERPAMVLDQRADRRPLVVAEHGVVAPDQCAQHRFGFVPHTGRTYRRGVTVRLTAATSRFHGAIAARSGGNRCSESSWGA
jgi:hypothetical protein